jgi:hypothetical protein
LPTTIGIEREILRSSGQGLAQLLPVIVVRVGELLFPSDWVGLQLKVLQTLLANLAKAYSGT